jgi:hypothetical protein
MSQEREDGEHRSASEEVHGGAVEGTDHGPGAGGAVITNVTITHAGTNWAYGPGGSGGSWGVVTSCSSLPYGTTFVLVGASSPAFATYADVKVEDEGIKVGEVIAYRAWSQSFMSNINRLLSVTMSTLWEPGKPMEGDPSNGNAGVYAFKTMEQCRKEMPSLFVFGTVALWGDIVEHEHGYRAQFARIISLDAGPDKAHLDLLRHEYGLCGAKPGAICNHPEPETPPTKAQAARMWRWRKLRYFAGYALTAGLTLLMVAGVALSGTSDLWNPWLYLLALVSLGAGWVFLTNQLARLCIRSLYNWPWLRLVDNP